MIFFVEFVEVKKDVDWNKKRDRFHPSWRLVTVVNTPIY